MDLLPFKLVATPLLVGGATLAARRWGPSVGGWIVALPLTSAPVLFFLALDQGVAFASDAARGTLVGLGLNAAWCLAYASLARHGPGAALAAALALYALFAAGSVPFLGAPFVPLAAGSAAGIALALRALPPRRPAGTVAHPRWDLPARVVLGTALVLALTTLAPRLGAGLSGLLATYPAYVTVLVVFTHLHLGPAGAVEVLRGVLTGLFGTLAFYVVLHPALPALGTGPAFLVASAASLAVQAVTLRRVRGPAAGAGPGVTVEPS